MFLMSIGEITQVSETKVLVTVNSLTRGNRSVVEVPSLVVGPWADVLDF